MNNNDEDSFVRFKFHTNLVGEAYKQFIHNVLGRFLYSVDTISDRDWLDHIVAQHKDRWNEEGYISNIYIESKFFTPGCKLYLYDETCAGLRRNIVFRDHYSREVVRNVYLISDAFEKFLIDNNITFSRHNRLR